MFKILRVDPEKLTDCCIKRRFKGFESRNLRDSGKWCLE